MLQALAPDLSRLFLSFFVFWGIIWGLLPDFALFFVGQGVENIRLICSERLFALNLLTLHTA